MRLTSEERCFITDSEPPNDEISDVHTVQEDEDLPTVDIDLMTEEEALALAAELDELDLPAIELTQEQALALVAELEAEYQPGQHYTIEPEQTPEQQSDVQSNGVCEEDKEERERQEKLKAEEQEMFRLSRAELQKRLAEIDEELELLRIRKEKRRKEQAEYLELIVQHEQERKERQEKERLKRQEEIEKKKMEREQRIQAMKNPLGFQQQIIIEEERPSPPKFAYKTPEEIAREKDQALSERVPPLWLNGACSKEAVKERTTDLQDRLKETYGTIFDLNEKMMRNDHDLEELRSRMGTGNAKVHDLNQFTGAGRVTAKLEEFQRGS